MSLRTLAGITAIVCGLSLAAAAQAPPTPPTASPGPAKVHPEKPAPGIPPPVRQGKDINIRIDGTVIESRGDKVVDKKVISVTCVDGRGAFVRSSQQVAFRAKGSDGFSYRDAPLNMDADVTLRDDGRVLARITVEYRTPATSESGDAIDGGIRQSVSVVLQPGVPLMVAQSADAVGDRRVALEVTATVLK
jgi:hypothetical protein